MNTIKHLNSTEGSSRYLNFCLGEEQFTIPLLAVQEVIAIPAITPVPNSPAYFLGIMNLRGKIISIVDLQLKLKTKKSNSKEPERAVIILDLGEDTSLGVVVDSVNSVLTFNNSQLSPCPNIEADSKVEYLSGIGRVNEQMYLMIDMEAVFHSDRKTVKSAAERAAPSGEQVA